MKRMLTIAAAVLALSACDNNKSAEKALLDDVLKVHDEVMGRDEKLMQNKMKLDTLIQTTTDTTEKIVMLAVADKLNKADAAMSGWMEKFDPSQDGKSHEEKIAYFTAQKKAVLAVDSQMQAAIKASDEYLHKNKK